jgi:hypothetical protein
MILSRKDEIKNILMKFLNSKDLVELIIFFEKDEIDSLSRIYWCNLFTHNRVRYINYYEHLMKSFLDQIIRMNGSIVNVNEENDIIRNLKIQNQEWADAWMRGIRF